MYGCRWLPLAAALFLIEGVCAAISAARGGAEERLVSDFGYDSEDSTRFLQAAIDSGAKRIVIDARRWVTLPLRGRSDQEIFFEDGAVLEAKKGAYLGVNDCIFTFTCCSNVVVGGKGIVRMHRDDYLKPPYRKGEWRHAVDLAGSSNVRIWGLTLCESGGDGVYVGGISLKRAKALGLPGRVYNCHNVVLEDLVCDGNARQGVSVTGVDGFRAERCVFRNTKGLPPQAGIDFEPNNSSNLMKGIVMRDCLFENNRGFGIELALSHSEPGKAEPFDMLFERCRTVGNASSVAVHNTRSDHTEIAGRIVFRDCSFEHPRGGALAINATPKCPFTCEITGCRIVEKDTAGHDAATAITEDWIERNIPFAAKNGRRLPVKPKVDYAELEVVDRVPGKTVKLPRLTFRNNSGFVFYAARPGPVNITWRQKVIGKFGKLRTGTARIVSMSDGKSATVPVPPEKPERLDFAAPAAGFYRIEVDAGRVNLSLMESYCPIAVDLTGDWQNLIASAGDFHFSVAERSPAFGFFVAGDGGEAVGVELVSPSGKVAWTKDAVFSWTGFISDESPEPGLWKATFRRPSRGTFEDWAVDLSGVEGFLFLSPDRYWKKRNE